MNWLKKEVAKTTGAEINPEPYDIEEMNTGCVFAVNDADEMHVVNAIHDLGDYECFRDEPTFDEETEEWSPSYYG